MEKESEKFYWEFRKELNSTIIKFQKRQDFDSLAICNALLEELKMIACFFQKDYYIMLGVLSEKLQEGFHQQFIDVKSLVKNEEKNDTTSP